MYKSSCSHLLRDIISGVLKEANLNKRGDPLTHSYKVLLERVTKLREDGGVGTEGIGAGTEGIGAGTGAGTGAGIGELTHPFAAGLKLLPRGVHLRIPFEYMELQHPAKH